MRISIIGAGHVGLVSGVCLAEKGHDVVCVDTDADKVDQINRGISPIHEPDLEKLLAKNHYWFRASTDLRRAVLQTDLSIVAVGTPFSDDEIDLRYVKEAARQIGAALRDKPGYHAVIIKSTVVPGTTEEVVLPLLEDASGKTAGADFGVGMNPEFLRAGEAVKDFLYPDRIVMGGIDEQTINMLESVYEPFQGIDRIQTSTRTAETIKYAANGLLATMISFSNEIANLCSAIGDVDVVDVMRGVHLDKRLTPIARNGERTKPGFTSYLEAGCGFGGSCFPKDVKALVAHGKKAGCVMRLLDAVIGVNEEQPGAVLKLLRKRFPELAGKKITVLGLAFKPGTSDIRGSPAIPILNELLAQHAIVSAFDPVARFEAEKIFAQNSVKFADTLEDAVSGAEAILVLTRWPEFEKLANLLAPLKDAPLVVDGRRMLDRRSFFKYEGIGLSQASDKGSVIGGIAAMSSTWLIHRFDNHFSLAELLDRFISDPIMNLALDCSRLA